MVARLRIFWIGTMGMILALPFMSSNFAFAAKMQAPAPATTMARQIGTVKAISGSTLTVATDAGQQLVVTVAEGAKVVQLAPGSTDLKTAQPATLYDIAVGDRVLAVGKPGNSAGELTALRVVLMKSSDIALKNAADAADWQKRGSGGIVKSVDALTGVLNVTSGGRSFEVKTAPTTKFRRYSGDSVKFEDAKPGTLAQIAPGDQVRVRGDRATDGVVQADEVISGFFKNLAGIISAVDPASGTITLKDLATKRTTTVKVTASSDIRRLPEAEAANYALRIKGGAAPSGSPTHTARAPAASGEPASSAAESANQRAAGIGLAQLLPQLPAEAIGDLKVGDAVMIVASQADAASTTATAVTLLTGVGPILKAMPNGSSEMTLSPWNMSGESDNGGGR